MRVVSTRNGRVRSKKTKKLRSLVVISTRVFTNWVDAKVAAKRGDGRSCSTTGVVACVTRYVNDHRFAESFLNRQIAKGLGAKRILLDAGQKGVSRDTLHALFAECEIDWYMQAAKTYQKKYGVCEQPLEYKEKTKRVRYMSYRGFSFDEIDFAIEAAMNAAEQEAIKGE